MRRPLFVALSVILAAVTTVFLPAATSADTVPPLPGSMASIGDSITRAADVCCWYGDHPSNSWSTGGAQWDSIQSHYERILARTSSIDGHQANDAMSGAKMADGPRQAEQAVSQHARYVTVEMGANDVCTSSRWTMTSVDSFRTSLAQTLATLEDGLPSGSHIFVASIPNVYQLWQIYHADLVAALVWQVAGICQSMLSTSNTETDRQAVLDREKAFNEVLRQECGKYANCRYDNGTVFAYQFSRSEVSKLDYFHPSLAGQAALARITWSTSWWPTL